jgi:hypothetical protein
MTAMAYTPELNQENSAILRRIAWALNLPMTKTMERVFEHVSSIVDDRKICISCKDDTFCEKCPFSKKG